MWRMVNVQTCKFSKDVTMLYLSLKKQNTEQLQLGQTGIQSQFKAQKTYGKKTRL